MTDKKNDESPAPSGRERPPAPPREMQKETAVEGQLEFLRANSPTYKALVRNMVSTFQSFQAKGHTLRAEGEPGGPPEAVRGHIPSLTVSGEKESFIVECATGPMLGNPQLADRLRTFAAVEGARLWLVVPFDVLADARALIDTIGGRWQVIVGDG